MGVQVNVSKLDKADDIGTRRTLSDIVFVPVFGKNDFFWHWINEVTYAFCLLLCRLTISQLFAD